MQLERFAPIACKGELTFTGVSARRFGIGIHSLNWLAVQKM